MTYDSCTYHPYVIFDQAQSAADNDYEFLPPSKRTVQLGDDMREEVAQFVVANREPVLPDIMSGFGLLRTRFVFHAHASGLGIRL